jgi:hypothetical protein
VLQLNSIHTWPVCIRFNAFPVSIRDRFNAEAEQADPLPELGVPSPTQSTLPVQVGSAVSAQAEGADVESQGSPWSRPRCCALTPQVRSQTQWTRHAGGVASDGVRCVGCAGRGQGFRWCGGGCALLHAHPPCTTTTRTALNTRLPLPHSSVSALQALVRLSPLTTERGGGGVGRCARAARTCRSWTEWRWTTTVRRARSRAWPLSPPQTLRCATSSHPVRQPACATSGGRAISTTRV